MGSSIWYDTTRAMPAACVAATTAASTELTTSRDGTSIPVRQLHAHADLRKRTQKFNYHRHDVDAAHYRRHADDQFSLRRMIFAGGCTFDFRDLFQNPPA